MQELPTAEQSAEGQPDHQSNAGLPSKAASGQHHSARPQDQEMAAAQADANMAALLQEEAG